MEYTIENVVRDLLLLAGHVHIVDHVPGRIRLRLAPSAVKVAGPMDLDRLINSIPGVLSTRLNPVVGSVVVEYDCNKLPSDLWESMMECNGDQESTVKIKERLTDLMMG